MFKRERETLNVFRKACTALLYCVFVEYYLFNNLSNKSFTTAVTSNIRVFLARGGLAVGRMRRVFTAALAAPRAPAPVPTHMASLSTTMNAKR